MESNLKRTANDVVQELLQQQELISELLPDARPRSFLPAPAEPAKRYTGARSTAADHDERNLLVCALRLLGASDRQIEEACPVTRRSIPLILAEYEKAGRVTPLKERLAILVGDNAERAGLALRELLDRAQAGGESMELAGMIKSVATALGITVEKHALLTGAATERIEVNVGAGRDEVESWARQFAIPIHAVASPVDTQSAENPPLSAATNQLQPMRHAADTDTTLTSPNDQTPAALPRRSEDASADPGGGLAFGDGGPKSPTSS